METKLERLMSVNTIEFNTDVSGLSVSFQNGATSAVSRGFSEGKIIASTYNSKLTGTSLARTRRCARNSVRPRGRTLTLPSSRTLEMSRRLSSIPRDSSTAAGRDPFSSRSLKSSRERWKTWSAAREECASQLQASALATQGSLPPTGQERRDREETADSATRRRL